MSQVPENAEPLVEEQLVAYLDGELDADASARIEEMLATDPSVRETLQRLDRTWELLGELDTSLACEDFAQTTLEMVAVAAGEDESESRRKAPRLRRRRFAITVGSLAAAGLAGFLAVALWTGDPNEALLEDLPVIENLDEYRQAGDLEFLRMLQKEGLFVEDEPAAVEEDQPETGKES